MPWGHMLIAFILGAFLGPQLLAMLGVGRRAQTAA
jgi:hypothetical protein